MRTPFRCSECRNLWQHLRASGPQSALLRVPGAPGGRPPKAATRPHHPLWTAAAQAPAGVATGPGNAAIAPPVAHHAARKEKAGRCARLQLRLLPPMNRRSGGLDVARLLALRARRHFERDLLAFLERLESRHVDRREVCEQVFAAAVRRNESEPLGVVKPLHSSSCHFSNSSRTKKKSGMRPGQCFDLKERTTVERLQSGRTGRTYCLETKTRWAGYTTNLAGASGILRVGYGVFWGPAWGSFGMPREVQGLPGPGG